MGAWPIVVDDLRDVAGIAAGLAGRQIRRGGTRARRQRRQSRHSATRLFQLLRKTTGPWLTQSKWLSRMAFEWDS